MWVWICVRSAAPQAARRKASTAQARYSAHWPRAQRQALAQRRLVDLDHADAGRLQVGHFLADGQGDLHRRVAPRLVVADKRPLQDRDRPGQHPLHRPLGERLGIAAPGHRHGPRPAHVAVDDRRLHAAGAVALHPAVAGEGEPFELLAEVFHHVVALALAVHQHVQVDLLLEPHRPLDLVAGRSPRSGPRSSRLSSRPPAPCGPRRSGGTSRWSWWAAAAAATPPAGAFAARETPRRGAASSRPRPPGAVGPRGDGFAATGCGAPGRPGSRPGRRRSPRGRR